MKSNYLNFFLQKALSVALLLAKVKPFVQVTAEELVFGYDDPFVTLAHQFYPKNKRPMSKMGLLLAVSDNKHIKWKAKQFKFSLFTSETQKKIPRTRKQCK